MSNILQAHVRIVGTRPLLQHRFGPDSIPLEKQERSGVAGNDPSEWRKTAMVTKDGQLYVEPKYVFACLCSGAKYTKKGKGSIQSLVAATLQVCNERIFLDRYLPTFPNKHFCDLVIVTEPPRDKTELVYLDVDSVRNPQTKGRNVRYRLATRLGWHTDFDILWDKTIVDRNQMQAVINDAGLFCGLGDGRSVGNGRFQVESFEMVEYAS